MGMTKNKISYCGDLIRKNDPDMFLISMFSKADIREDIWALFAFNYEIAKTRFVVSDATLGLIRLQWWRDAIKGIYEGGEELNHEVLKPLAQAIDRHSLSRSKFDKLIYAREFDLEGVSPANLEGLMNYAEFTTEPLLKLVLEILGVDPDLEVLQAVSINFALARLLLASPYYLHNDCILFPEDLMVKYGVTKDNIFSDEGRGGLISVVKEIIDGKLAPSSSKHYIIKAHYVLSDMYFKQIISCNYDVMSQNIQRNSTFKVLKLLFRIKIM